MPRHDGGIVALVPIARVGVPPFQARGSWTRADERCDNLQGDRAVFGTQRQIRR